MDDTAVPSSEGDAEELEPIEDLEDAVDESGGVEGSELSSAFLRDLARGHNRHTLAQALLDSRMAFIHQNPPFKALVREFHYSSKAPFPSIFADNLTDSSPEAILEALNDPRQGYGWAGNIEHRAKDKPSRLTKVFVESLWPAEEGTAREDVGDAPKGWRILVDDRTLEYKGQRREGMGQLLKASLKKDRDTGNHVHRVNLYARRLAEELFRDPRWPEVDVDYIEEIGFLAAMHDIGKIGTPDDILNKKGPLNETEWKIMREHTINGAFILADDMAKEIARSHHEWWNGSGYPFNLFGAMIPLSARIVSVADVYDALRMERSYKRGYTHEVTVAKMAEEKGSHFDPDLIDVFVRIAESFARIYEAYKDQALPPD